MQRPLTDPDGPQPASHFSPHLGERDAGPPPSEAVTRPGGALWLLTSHLVAPYSLHGDIHAHRHTHTQKVEENRHLTQALSCTGSLAQRRKFPKQTLTLFTGWKLWKADCDRHHSFKPSLNLPPGPVISSSFLLFLAKLLKKVVSICCPPLPHSSIPCCGNHPVPTVLPQK